MARRMNGLSYEFVGLRDGGDGVVGIRDKIIVRDEFGQRHEFYLGDEQAERVLSSMGFSCNDIMGLPIGQAQGRLSFTYHIQRAKTLADVGDYLGMDSELKQAETGARFADRALDPHKIQAIEALRGRSQDVG